MNSGLSQRPVNGEWEPARQSGGSQGPSGPQSSCRGPRFNSVGHPPWGLHALCFSHGSLYPGQLLLPPATQGPTAASSQCWVLL